MTSSKNQSFAITTTKAPSVEEIERIAALTNPVIRNLQISNCYSRLSAAFAARATNYANWCTFATWASKQAGQTIRGEDLERTIEAVLIKEQEIGRHLSLISSIAKQLGSEKTHEQIQKTALGSLIKASTERASDAVARGNKKVFEEIGREFARFIATCGTDVVYDESHINEFGSQLRPGEPPEGQKYLRLAFTRYYTSFFESDLKRRTELCLLANLEIGFHEQTRLQPEIAESLNAAQIDPEHIIALFFKNCIPEKGLLGKLLSLFKGMASKKNLLNKAIESLVTKAEGLVRKIITAELMTLTLPPQNCLHLGRDLTTTFPSDLEQLENSELVALLTQIDPTKDSLRESGAVDWADLKDRIHFIADLFRCYHESKELFNECFTPEQLAILNAGGLPAGRL